MKEIDKKAIAEEVRKRAERLDDEPLRETLWLASSLMKACSAHGNECSSCSAFYICAVIDCSCEVIWQELHNRMNEAIRASEHEKWEK